MNPTYTIFQIVRLLWARLNHRGIVEVLVNDYPQTLREILKDHPELIRPSKDRTPAWMHTLATSIEQNQAIPPIKAIRENMGLGLKEAKDLMDHMRQGAKPGYCSPSHEQSLKKFPLAIQQAVRKAELQRLGL
jgi:ribosomal protein L7/L12